MGVGVDFVGASISACSEHHRFGIEDRHLTRFDIVRDYTLDTSVGFVIDDIGDIPLIFEFDIEAIRLFENRL
ncbi:hypothetical protein D3C81_2153680 [compost metagenome]